MVNKTKISIIVNTFNEEKNISRCLETVKWADEIVLVDMYSEDKTVEIAKKYTNKIYFFEKKYYVEPARQFAFSKTSHEWVLIVDADELVPVTLKNKLYEIAENDLADIVRIPHNNYFFGKLMRGTRWGALQDMHFRFFKKSFMSFTAKIHGGVVISKKARIYTIIEPESGFIHFNYIDFDHFINKFNSYSSIDAQNIYEKIKPEISLGRAILWGIKEFIGRFIKNKGYRDGINGFALSLLMSIYKIVVYAKYKLMVEFGSKDPQDKIGLIYTDKARKIIKEYNTLNKD